MPMSKSRRELTTKTEDRLNKTRGSIRACDSPSPSNVHSMYGLIERTGGLDGDERRGAARAP
eukprot:scaffold188659_cov30-Tisochrysis_lutea.AAC.1